MVDESEYVDDVPYEGKPDFKVPPSHQHVGLEETQDDEAKSDA